MKPQVNCFFNFFDLRNDKYGMANPEFSRSLINNGYVRYIDPYPVDPWGRPEYPPVRPKPFDIDPLQMLDPWGRPDNFDWTLPPPPPPAPPMIKPGGRYPNGPWTTPPFQFPRDPTDYRWYA